MMYIEPPYQIPMRAESLHTERVTVDFSCITEAFINAFTPVVQALSNVTMAIVEAVEDATRDNAYHPTGPVVRSTAYTAPEIFIVAPMEEENHQS